MARKQIPAKTYDEKEFPAGLAKLKKSLETDRPKDWEAIPDIELYLDQVLSYMPRQHIGLLAEESLTGAMVNNYTKKGLLPRARGKKYDKSHLAYLTTICLFKQVLSVDETDLLLKYAMEDQDIKDFYEEYCKLLDKALTERGEEIEETMSRQAVVDLILQLAVSSYSSKLACERLLALLKSE